MSTVAFDGKVKMEWFQTADTVTLTFYVKQRSEADVEVVSAARSLNIRIRLDAAGRVYEHTIDPTYAALAEEGKASVSVRPMKVEVSVKKVAAVQWPGLEGVDSDAAPAAAAAAAGAAAAVPSSVAGLPASAKELSYPNSRGKDWSAVKLDDDEDAKPEGEQALNELFKKIYGDGSDEQRRAMIKSFTESGGTVLSTNWGDVGKKKVEAQPPKGMEAKRIDE